MALLNTGEVKQMILSNEKLLKIIDLCLAATDHLIAERDRQ